MKASWLKRVGVDSGLAGVIGMSRGGWAQNEMAYNATLALEPRGLYRGLEPQRSHGLRLVRSAKSGKREP